MHKKKQGDEVLEKWKASHITGDLNDRKILREALAYQNYLDSPKHVQVEAEKAILDKCCADLSDDGIKPTAEQCCLGTPFHPAGKTAYFVLPRKDVLPKPAPYAKLEPEFLLDTLLKCRRQVLFISDWADDAGNSALPAPDLVNCGELARGLGLCGTNWKKGRSITIIALNVEKIHKPTWLDSGLTFFWYAAPSRPDWGLSRSLETGRPTLREWVLPKRDGAFKVENYWDRNAEEDYDFTQNRLRDMYWNTCAKELRP